MGWYFRRGTQAFGPVGDEELRMLVRRGTIDKRTLLQAEGGSEWRPAETLVPTVFETPPPADGASAPVRYEEVFPGSRESAESVSFSSGGFSELDAFVDEISGRSDVDFSSDAGAIQRQQATTPPPPRTPVRPQPQEPVQKEDSKAVCFGCGRLLRRTQLSAYHGALICGECLQRQEERAKVQPEPPPEPGFFEAHLAEWLCEGAVTIIGLALFLGFMKGKGVWMLAAAPMAPAAGVLAACICGGLDYDFGRRMVLVTVFLWLGALFLYLPASVTALVMLLAGRGAFIWALGFHDIKKKGLFLGLALFLTVSVLAGVLLVRKVPTSSLVLVLALAAADVAAGAMSWGAWQAGASLAVAGFGSLLYVWDAAAIYYIQRPQGIVAPAFLTVGLVALSVLAVLGIDKETGRPKQEGRGPLRREPLPLTATDAVIAALAGIAVAAFALLVLRKGPGEPLFYVHCVLLAALVLIGTEGRLPHPNHVKWLMLAWGLAILVARIVPFEKAPLYAHTLVKLSKTYPVLNVGQLVQLAGGVALACFVGFHMERALRDSVRPWHKYLMVFLVALGIFALREVVEMPLAASYPKLVSHTAYAAVFDLVFAGAGLILGIIAIRFQERE
ncbi:MAG TPA: DUF4339 domain-containing protein [Candidatus Hydrogenedentes bacterium]|nr:DUF4339 domain-containing protein [Candidatus Hydrogenedentota bacterium]HQH66834.1 DUF4339 domain-containing protein [Candidatus Hydrogenedentota bacterium]